MKYAILVAFVGVPVALILGFRALARKYRSHDPHLSAIVPPTPIPGMEKMDWTVANRASDRRWVETLQAQRRYQKQDRPRLVSSR